MAGAVTTWTVVIQCLVLTAVVGEGEHHECRAHMIGTRSRYHQAVVVFKSSTQLCPGRGYRILLHHWDVQRVDGAGPQGHL